MSRKLSDAKYRALVKGFAERQAEARYGMLSAKRYGELAVRFQWKQTVARDMTAEAAKIPATVPPVASKCVNPDSGEPVSGVDRNNPVPPVPGSEREQPNGTRKGTCPLCGAFVKVSAITGGVGAHTVRTETVKPPKRLSEPRMDVTDTGPRIGAPEASHKLRLTDIDGAFQRGVVMVPVPQENGRDKLEEAEPTEENLRAALDYVKSRKPRKAEAKRAQSEAVSALVRRLDALRKGEAALQAPEAGAATGGRGHGSVDGSALVKGRPLTPMAGPVTVRHVSDPVPERPTVTDGVDTRTSSTEDTTFHTSEGMVLPDPVAAQSPPARKPLTRTQRRNATRRRKAAELKAENARLRAELDAARA